jgi:hypothetical protein
MTRFAEIRGKKRVPSPAPSGNRATSEASTASTSIQFTAPSSLPVLSSRVGARLFRYSELHESMVGHHDVGPLFEGQIACAVVIDDLELAHSVTHGPA